MEKGLIEINQYLKNRIYGTGSQKHVDFLSKVSGMNDLERRMFQMLHERKPDEVIASELGLSKNSYNLVEECVRVKVTLAVFECINHYMDVY